MKTVMLALLSVALMGCGFKDKPHYTVPKDFREWRKPVDKVLDYPVPGHGPTFRVIYADEKCYNPKVMRDERGIERVVMPEGCVVIKEVFMKRSDVNKKEGALTIMKKDSADRKARDGWLYFMKKPREGVMLVESIMCIGCHEAANEPHPYFDKNKKGIFRDYLFVNFIHEEE